MRVRGRELLSPFRILLVAAMIAALPALSNPELDDERIIVTGTRIPPRVSPRLS